MTVGGQIKDTRFTLEATFSVRTPRNKLSAYVALAIYDDHRCHQVGEVGYALVTHDRDELCPWVPLGQDTDVLAGAVAAVDPGFCERDQRAADFAPAWVAHPSL
jgi:hypothetical protein